MTNRPTGIVTVASGKGGSGKTTSALAIAGGLKKLGVEPDALIDLDYGASATRVVGYAPQSGFSEALLDGRVSFADALHETAEVPIVPASADLAKVGRDRMYAWLERLRELGRQYLLVIDTSDDILSTPVAAAILAADVIALPVPITQKAYQRTFPEIGGLLASQQREPELVWFGTMVDQRPAVTRHILKQIAQDGVELSVLVPRGVAADEADFQATSVIASSPKSKVAVAYMDLATIIYARLRRLTGASPGAERGRPTRELAAPQSRELAAPVNG
jgi:septum site-determining protein MinD